MDFDDNADEAAYRGRVRGWLVENVARHRETRCPWAARAHRCLREAGYSIALTMSSTTFLASPKTIMVLSM